MLPANPRPSDTFEPSVRRRDPTLPQQWLRVAAEIAAFCSGLACQSSDRSGAIGDADRRRLCERTLENLELRQDTVRSSLHEFCRKQAKFVLTLPEGNQSRRESPRRFMPGPIRQ
jgi:hypothetical protein